MDPDYAKLEAIIRQYLDPETDLTKVREAYELAKKAHAKQFRQSGEPYIVHPLQVAMILANLELESRERLLPVCCVILDRGSPR